MGIKSIGKVSFDAIYDAHAEEIYQIALYYSGNHHAAEEITQSVFMKLYVNLDHANIGNVPEWLRVTAKHMTLNYKKHYYRQRPEENIEEILDDVEVADSAEDEFMDRLCEEEYKEFADSIFEELYRVNKRWYYAITITYCLEKPQKEVAETMGVSLEVLHSMLYRAKKWIRKHYEERYGHLDDA